MTRNHFHEIPDPLLMGHMSLRASYTFQNSFQNFCNSPESSENAWKGKGPWSRQQERAFLVVEVWGQGASVTSLVVISTHGVKMRTVALQESGLRCSGREPCLLGKPPILTLRQLSLTGQPWPSLIPTRCLSRGRGSLPKWPHPSSLRLPGYLGFPLINFLETLEHIIYAKYIN